MAVVKKKAAKANPKTKREVAAIKKIKAAKIAPAAERRAAIAKSLAAQKSRKVAVKRVKVQKKDPSVLTHAKEATAKLAAAIVKNASPGTFRTMFRGGNTLSVLGAIGKRRVVVFDLDNCITDDAWRFVFVKNDAATADERFADYHAASVSDKPLAPGLLLLTQFIEVGVYPVFITARPEATRTITEEWLYNNVRAIKSRAGYSLLMRGDADERETVGLKRELFELLISTAPKAEIVGAYDDREDIVTMYGSVFGVNAFRLDPHGVTDILNLNTFRARGIKDDPVKPPILGHDSHEKEYAKDECWGNAQSDRRDYNDIPDVLRSMAETFESRNADYGNSGIKFGDVMAVLFPNGYTARGAADYRIMASMEQVISKLVRFVNSGLKHQDSIHDLGCYAALVEADIPNHSIKMVR